jgi:hypothetical protein
LSDLASSCEYLNIDKTCVIFSDHSKVKANNRQLKCKNDQKTICCYLCIFRSQCAISCKYLEPSENHAESKSIPKETCTVDNALQTEPLPLESISAAFCVSCNIEMTWTKTQFMVDNWHGPQSIVFNDKVLPVTVFLCSKCGKIEFKADLVRKGVEV